MRTITSILAFFIFGVFAIGQNGTKIIITGTPKQVPPGKVWKLKAGVDTKVQLDRSTLNSGSLCNAMFRSKPGIIFNLNQGDLFNAESHSIIFQSFEKVPYTNDYTYIIKPISIVDKSFKLEDLEYSKAEDIGSNELTFIEGEKVFVASCLQSIELTEFGISKTELQLEIKKREQRKTKIDNSAAKEEREKLIDNQRRIDIQQKIAENYVFDPDKLDEIPRFIGNREAMLSYYKYSLNYRFGIYLIINEDGSFELSERQETKFDSIILKFLKFSPGYFLINNEKYFVKTKMELIFMERGINKLEEDKINIEVKKLDKPPYYKILSENDSKNLNYVNSIIDFSKTLSNFPKDKFMFNIYNQKIKADIYLAYGHGEDPIIKKEIDMPVIRYIPSGEYLRYKSNNWKYINPNQYLGYDLLDPKYALGKDNTNNNEKLSFDIPINTGKYVDPETKPEIHDKNISEIVFSSNAVIFKYNGKGGLDPQSVWSLDLTSSKFLMNSNQGFNKSYTVEKFGYDEKMGATKFELSESGSSTTHDLYVSYANNMGYSVVLFSRDRTEEFQFQDIKVTKKN